MTDTPQPAPTPSGYQPAQGEGLTEVTVEVTPSWGYQKATVSGTVTFAMPRSYADALPAIEDLYEALEQSSAEKVDRLVALKEEREGANRQKVAASAGAAAPAAPATVPQTPGTLPWRQGAKPNGKGTFRYLPSSYISTDALKAQAELQLDGLGVSKADVNIFDNRVGQYGLESGHDSYSVGVIKAKDDSPLLAALGGKAIIGNVDFNGDGSVRATLSKDGKTAVQAISIAQQLGGTPVAGEEELPF